MRRTSLVAAIALIDCLTPTIAAAQNDVTGEFIFVHTTFHSVGVMVTITGDDNRNATAALEIDYGSGYVQAHPLSRPNDDVATDRFVGSAFFLAPGTAFTVSVTLDDPDGVENGNLATSGITRELQVPTSSGDTWHVSPDGDDDNPGSEGEPFATVARGIQAAGAGDTVLLHEGVYHEEIEIYTGGDEDDPLTITAADGDTAVMDGADPGLKLSSAWTDEGGGVYSAPVSQTRYVSVDGTRLWRYESMADLQGLSEGTDGGFYFDGANVYVRLPGDAAPDGHEIQVSTLMQAFSIDGAHDTVVRGLTIRCYGGAQYARGIMVRDGAHRTWIVDTTFENVMPGVWVKGEVDDLTVMDNEFSDVGLAEFPWYAVKAQGGMESGAIAVDGEYQGQGIVFHNNYVHDSFDGLNICGGEETSMPNNADVIGNTIRHLGDDGIEADGFCQNVRIMLNRFEDSLVGVSAAPGTGGPVFAIRNLIADLNNVSPDTTWSTRAFKFNVSSEYSTGDVFAYHNTAVTYEPDQAAFAVTDESVWQHLVLLNNIWVGTDDAFSFSNTGDEPFDQDFDLLHTTGDGFIYYQGAHYASVDEYHSATGQCESCLAGDPLFVDPEGGTYELQEASPAADQGVVIPGVNDDFVGEGPDMGAYEIGGAGPDADIDSDADSDVDTDADADADTDADGDPVDPGAGGESDSCGCESVGRGGGRLLGLIASVLI
jgi:hypothetical protein